MKSSLFILLSLASLSCYSQVSLSGVSYVTTDVPSVADPVMQDSAFATIEFLVTNYKVQDQVVLKAGSEEGKQDILSLPMVAVEKNGTSYLALGEDWYKIEKSGKVSIRKVIPKVNAVKSTYIAIEASDKNGKKYQDPGAELKQRVK